MISETEVFAGLFSAESLNQGPPYTTVWKIRGDLPYFSGHFPGNPIFPAVGIVDASLYFLRAVLQQPHLYVSHFPIAKFLSPIQPEQVVRIELTPLNKNEWQAEWKDEGSQKLLATLRFQL